MLLKVTVRISRLKSGKRPPSVDAFAHPPNTHWNTDPRIIVPLRPKPGQDAEMVVSSVLRVSEFDWEAPENIWKMEHADSQPLVIAAVRAEVRRTRDLLRMTKPNVKETA